MSHKSYNAEEREQKLLHQIRNNSILSNMMDESTAPNSNKIFKKLPSLHMDEVELGSEYNGASAPPAITVLRDCDLDDGNSNKHKRYYKNMMAPIVAFVLGVVIVAAIFAVVVVSTEKKDITNPKWISNAETIETQMATPSRDEATYDFRNFEDFDVENDICDPKIRFHKELYPQSTPTIASDGETIVVKHGTKLNFYEQDRGQSYAYLSLHQTHGRSVNSNEPEDFTLAIDGSTSILGDYTQDEETGAVYVMKDNGQGERTTTQFIAAPDDVNDGGRFGYSVDIHNDRLIVGAPFGYDEGSGSAYIYAKTDEGTWELENIFPPLEEDGPEDDFELFGESVAIHENRAAISGYNELDEVTVFIYEFSPLSASWEEIDDIIVDKNCQNCLGVGVDLSFRHDGGLFISYPRKNEVSYLVPTSFENGGDYVLDYVLVQTILVDEDGDVDMDEVEVGGEIMAVSVTNDENTSLVYVYSQSDDNDKWEKVDEIELPPNDDFDPDEDFIDLALSRNNLIVNYGDAKLIWYTLEGCD